jgi:signal transduction histidine kinase
MLALLGFTLWRRGNRERTLGWATVLLAAWSTQQLIAAAPSALPFVLRGTVFTSTRLLLLYAIVGLTDDAGTAPLSRWRRALPWVVMASGLLELTLLLTVSDERSVVVWRMFSMGLDLLLVSVAIVRGLRRVLRDATVLEGRAPEALILSVLLSLLALEPIQALFRIGGSGDLSASFALLAIAMALVFAARTAAEYRSASQVTHLLTTRLTAKEQELATVFAAQRESARQQARLEERTRLMRDMHDGIGGRLLSLEAQLRHAAAPPPSAHVADELRGALDELRLIVDSLDTAGDDLGVALGAFRGRMAPRLRAAGLALEWSVDDGATTPPLSASAVLDVYRILQEACTNVLRHAGATRFRVSLRRLPDGTRVLEMHDDGVGMPADAETRGRGVSNMQARAARLGGTLSRRDGEPGTCLRLELPSVPPS